MTSISQMDCCTMLGIDPKTLRNWLRHANMQFATHPTDARLKCLTQEQVQHLATLHARPFLAPATVHPARISVTSLQEHEVPLCPTTTPRPLSCMHEADLSQSFARLQAQMASLQEQLAQLALQLLRERQLRTEQRLSTLEALVQPPLASPQALQATTLADPPDAKPHPERPLLPAPVRTYSRVRPLVEYGAAGTYVVICPTLGELSFPPDSSEWVAWLATLTSFRFVGQQGSVSIRRKKDRSCYWLAQSRVHGRRYELALGTTAHLTVARLEQAVVTLQSRIASLS